LVEKALIIVFSYFLGAIPVGVMVAKRFGFDILASGSGNPGATNVWRTVGPRAGKIVFLLDTLKGCIPAVAGLLLVHGSYASVVGNGFDLPQRWGMFAGLAAVLGHTFSPFLKFKGGKGIATAFGAGLGSVPLVALSAIAVFGVLLWITRYVSLSSIIAIASAALFGFLFRVDWEVQIALWGLMVFVIFKHRANIARLRNGTESKFGLNHKTPPNQEARLDGEA